MLTEDEKIRRLKSLTRKEMEVVYYFGQGMNDKEIRAKLKINVQGSLNTRRTGIYKKLRIFNKESTEVGFKVDDVEKPKCLAREYVPLIPLVCPDENALKLWVEIPFEENQNIKEDDKNNQVDNTKKSEGKEKKHFNFGIFFFAFLVVIVVLSAYLSGKIGTQNNSPAIPSTFTIAPITTNTIQPTLPFVVPPINTVMPSFTPTITITNTETLTPIPSITFTPTPTPLGVGGKYSDDRVTLQLMYRKFYDTFWVGSGGEDHTPIILGFRFTNHSTETIILRFQHSDFTLTDNTGRTYPQADPWNADSGLIKVSTSVVTGDSFDFEIGYGRAIAFGSSGVFDFGPDTTYIIVSIDSFSSLTNMKWMVEIPK